jgi:hypothetical protein
MPNAGDVEVGPGVAEEERHGTDLGEGREPVEDEKDQDEEDRDDGDEGAEQPENRDRRLPDVAAADR